MNLLKLKITFTKQSTKLISRALYLGISQPNHANSELTAIKTKNQTVVSTLTASKEGID